MTILIRNYCFLSTDLLYDELDFHGKLTYKFKMKVEKIYV